jgi:hypothetical protein
MQWSWATVGLLLLQAAAPPEVRTFQASVVDSQGDPVLGLSREEVAVVENGVAREVTSIEADDRPLVVAVLVDNSAEIASSYRLEVVNAVSSFLSRLPEGSRFTVWTTGDRPTRLVELGSDVPAVTRALAGSPTTGGNTLLDALVEGTSDLRKEEGSRSAVVVVTGITTNFGNRDRLTVVNQAQGNADVFYAVEFDEGLADFDDRAAYGYVLGNLTKRTGGLYERPLTAMGLSPLLARCASDLRGRYRVTYASLPEAPNRDVRFEIARPGAKARLAAPPEEAR